MYVAVSDELRRAAAPGSAAGQDSVYGVPYELDPKVGGGLFALKVESGETAWQTPHPECVKTGCSPAQSAAVSAIPGVVFSGGVDGHLRAYSTKDGRIILCEWFNTPLLADDGRFGGLLCLGQDVTERRRAEEALRRSETRYRIVSELASDFTYAIRLRSDGSPTCRPASCAGDLRATVRPSMSEVPMAQKRQACAASL